MGRGGDDQVALQKRSLSDLKELKSKTEKAMEKDLPSYVGATNFRPGFVVSFVHEARVNQTFETPKLSQAMLKSPALFLSFEIDKKLFLKQEGLEEEAGVNSDKILAVYLSNRLLPLATMASGGRVVQGGAMEDSDGLEESVALQNISFDSKNKVTYSLVLS